MFWGDLVNIALQVDDPDISLRFDSDAAAAAATRRRLLEDAARKGLCLSLLATCLFRDLAHQERRARL